MYLVNFVQDFTNFTEIQFLWAGDSDIHIHDDHNETYTIVFVRIQTNIIRDSNDHLSVRPGNWPIVHTLH